MSYRHTITHSWSNGTSPVQGQSVATGDGEDNRQLSIPAATTNQQILIALTIAQLQSAFLMSDQDVTIKTNSTGSPQETIALKANQPITWATGLGQAALFGGNVTTMYISNAGASAATVNLCFLSDSTP